MQRLRTSKRAAPDPAHIEVMDWEVVELSKRLTGAERVELGFKLGQIAVEFYLCAVRLEYPTWDSMAVLEEAWKHAEQDGPRLIAIEGRLEVDQAWMSGHRPGPG